MDQDFDSSTVYQTMNMSRTTFFRKFTGLTGKNISDFIRKFRVIKAAELFRSGKTDVLQVSQMVGFKTVGRFRINFKNEFGKTPTEFINSGE